MNDTTKAIVLCENKSQGSRILFDLLQQDLTEANFEHYKFLQLLQKREALQPYVIVCDFATSPFKKALVDIERLREAFPKSGLIIYYNGTELEPETIKLRFITCHNQLLLKMAESRFVTQQLVDRAFSWSHIQSL